MPVEDVRVTAQRVGGEIRLGVIGPPRLGGCAQRLGSRVGGSLSWRARTTGGMDSVGTKAELIKGRKISG